MTIRDTTKRAAILGRQFGNMGMSAGAAMAVARAEHRPDTASDIDGAEIRIYTALGDDWFGFTSEDMNAALTELDGQDVTLRINSPGGNVWDAVAMYNMLNDYPGNVTAIIDGEASSAASFFPMAADRIEMAGNGMMMIHNAWVLAVGNSSELRDVATVLEKVDGLISSTYAARSGRDQEEFATLMAAETFLTPDEALGLGLIDHVRPLKGKSEAAARINHADSELAKMAVAAMRF